MKKRVLTLMLAAVFAVSTLAGCGDSKESQGNQESQDKQEESKQEESKQEDSQEVQEEEKYAETVSYEMWLSWTVEPTDYQKTIMMDYIKEKFNIDLTLRFNLNTDQVSTAIASGELPDLITGYPAYKNIFDELAEEGKLLQLDDYVETVLYDYVDTCMSKEVLDSFRDPNGDLYILPGNTYPSDPEKLSLFASSVNRALGVREDILEDLGLSIPTSADELYDTLVKIKEANLTTSTGEKIYPMATMLTNNGNLWYQFYNTLFGATCFLQDEYFDETEQKAIQDYDLPEFVEMLKFISKLYREGLIPAESLSIGSEQEWDTLANTGRVVFYYGNPWNITGINNVLPNIDEDAEFVPVNPIASEYASISPYNTTNPYGQLVTAISADVEDVDRLMDFLAWSFSPEGYTYLYYGLPGEHDGYHFWDLEEDGTMVAVDALTQRETDAWLGENWYVNTMGGYAYHPTIINYDFTKILVGAKTADDFTSRCLYDGYLETSYTANSAVNLVGSALSKIADGPVEKDKGISVGKVLNEGAAKIIVEAQSDEEVETMWAEVLADADKAGRQEILKELYDLQYETYLKLTGE